MKKGISLAPGSTWTFHGKEIPYTPFGLDEFPTGQVVWKSIKAREVTMYDLYISLVNDPNPAAIIRAEQINDITGLETQSIPSPTGKPKWSREAISKLISNEKYTGRVLLQKTISAGGAQIKNDGFMERYLYSNSHEAVISDEIFRDARQRKLQRTNQPKKNLPFNYSFDSIKLSNACCDTYGIGMFISTFKSTLPYTDNVSLILWYFSKMGIVIFVCYAIIWIKRMITPHYLN